MDFFTIKIATPILSIILGILVLLFPKLLRVFVGIWLLVFGILGLLT